MLVEEEAKTKQASTGEGKQINLVEASGGECHVNQTEASGGGSQGSLVTLTEASGNLSQASMDSSQEGWFIETQFRNHLGSETERNIVGVFTSREEAIRNAKIAFANMDSYDSFTGYDIQNYSEKFTKDYKGGVLFSLWDEYGEGGSISANMYKCFIDNAIKPKHHVMYS